MTKPARKRPGPESTLDQVRADLISAGAKLLRERGAELGLAKITLNDAIREAGVSRSTAYRSLAHDDLLPQAVLHQEVLTQLLARHGDSTGAESVANALATEFERHAAVVADGSVQERTAAFRSLLRVGTNTSFTDQAEDPERAILTAIYGALGSSSEPHDWRHDALFLGEANLVAMFTAIVNGFCDVFDYGVKEPFTMEQVVVIGAALAEGLAMRYGFNKYVTMVDRPTGPDGALEEWSLLAIGFENLFLTMCGPRNPEEPFADLNRY